MSVSASDEERFSTRCRAVGRRAEGLELSREPTELLHGCQPRRELPARDCRRRQHWFVSSLLRGMQDEGRRTRTRSRPRPRPRTGDGGPRTRTRTRKTAARKKTARYERGCKKNKRNKRNKKNKKNKEEHQKRYEVRRTGGHCLDEDFLARQPGLLR